MRGHYHHSRADVTKAVMSAISLNRHVQADVTAFASESANLPTGHVQANVTRPT